MIRLEHLALWVGDLEAMRRFYTEYFGMTASARYVNSAKGFASYFLSSGAANARIELMNGPASAQARPGSAHLGLAHFAFSVGGREQVDRLTERLRADGYTVAGEPRTTGDGYYESVVLDPEGNRIEICA